MDLDEAVLKALTISAKNSMVFPNTKRKWTNDAAVVEMLRPCRDEEDYNLVYELFQQLDNNILDGSKCYDLLCDMAEAIKKNETEGVHTALCVMRTKNDPDADGSQAIVNDLKIALKLTGDFKYSYSAVCFEDIERLYRKGYRHFIVVDDFIGSGKTVDARYQYFLNRNLADATIGFYFLAGMTMGLNYCRNRNIPVHCCMIMNKGITDHYHKKILPQRTLSMNYFESLLGKESGTAKLEENSWGYGHAEALWCRQFGNIPNSVFPIFWWNKNLDGSNRQTVFTRVQDGY